MAALTKKRDKEWEYSMPYTQSQVAGRILATQMKIIHKSGGYYNSISRISFWEEDKLDYFFLKTENAVKAGREVKRVFNLCDNELNRNLLKKVEKQAQNLKPNSKKPE